MEQNPTLRLALQPKETYGAHYQEHLFEQYKLCVEMADRVSSRRMLANSFFLALHTAVVTAFAALLTQRVLFGAIGVLPFVAAIILCFVWWFILRSYRQLNTGKFEVILALEQLLPAAPYDAEWDLLGRGQKRRLYWTLTNVERWVPFCFAVLYLGLALSAYLSG